MPQSISNMPRVFAALSDPTRFAIVEQLLAHEELPIGELAAPYAMSKPAISKHIKVLEDAGLIERRVEKQWRYCRLRRECFSGIEDWLGRYRDFWSTSLDRLDAILIEEDRDNQDD